MPIHAYFSLSESARLDFEDYEFLVRTTAGPLRDNRSKDYGLFFDSERE
jgi:hypothetical protein